MNASQDPIFFPDPRLAESDGLVAVGGELSVPWLISAYRQGVFPWTVNPVSWWSPDPRGMMELDGFHASKSLRRTLRKGLFEIRFDTAFREVITECAIARKDGNWITREFIDAYERFHREGYAHSVECWQGDRLVGGVYGVAMGAAFSGESMFHRVSDASKVALFHLVEHLRARGYAFLDVQMVTPTSGSLGANEVARDEFLERLKDARDEKLAFQ